MSDVPRPRLLLTILAGLMIALSGCNLSDPIASLPTAGCEDDGDCSDHGTCEIANGVGTCSCDRGYDDDDCGDCDDGYERQPDGSCELAMSTNNTNNNSNNNNSNNNNTNGDCEDDEVLVDGQCIVDGCASNPCGDGTCETTGDNSWVCTCPDGSTGIECGVCADSCVNGTCNDDFECICEQGWDGDSCTECAPGFQGAMCDTCTASAFGPNCDTCATINAAEPWWDPNYATRRALIVYNPDTSTSSILDNIVVQHEFRHDLLVLNAGSDPFGADVRVVNSPANELHRILGFDSEWNANDTEIWFPTATSIAPGEFDVYYVYSGNPMPALALGDSAQVLIRERGWYRGPNGPVYSPQPMQSGTYSIQLRQKNPLTMEVYFYDASDAPNAFAEVKFFNTATGMEVGNLTYGASLGSSAVPSPPIFDEVTGLPNSMRAEITIDSGTDDGAIILGADIVYSGRGLSTFPPATLSRSTSPSAPPQVFECSPEMQP